MSFERAIDILRHSTRPPLNIIVLWRELEANAGIDRTTEIGIDGVSGIRLRQCLELLLTSLSATSPVRIGYAVEHGVITIATVDSLPQPKRVTRVYDITDLAAPPSQAGGFGMMPGMGMMPGGMGMGMMPGMGMGGMGMGMMPGMGMGMGGMPYGGAGGYAPGGYSPGYGNYGGTQGYSPLGGLPGFLNSAQGQAR